jgi:hypothetical protein
MTLTEAKGQRIDGLLLFFRYFCSQLLSHSSHTNEQTDFLLANIWSCAPTTSGRRARPPRLFMCLGLSLVEGLLRRMTADPRDDLLFPGNQRGA